MDIEKNKEKIKLQFDIIKRTDSYIATTNNKAALLLAVNGATATIISNKAGGFIGLFGHSKLYSLVMCILFFLIAFFISLSFFCSLKSIIPNMSVRKGKNDAKDSNVSFVYIANLDGGQKYFDRYSCENEDDLLLDMCQQSFILSYIAKEKFIHFSTAVSWIKRAYVCLTILVALKFINYANGVLL